MAERFVGFSEDDIRRVNSGDSLKEVSAKSSATVPKRQVNQVQSLAKKNVTRSRMLQKPLPVAVEMVPEGAYLSKPKKLEEPKQPEATQPHAAEVNSDSGCGVSPLQTANSTPTLSPSHAAVCLKIKEGKAYEVITPEKGGIGGYTLDEFQARQKLMEEQNRQRKELLAKALADRKKQTTAEARRLQQIQEELQKLDLLLSNDVGILRNQIEVASMEFMEAQKRYDKAEKEFLEAKLILFEKLERKELLTEHLCTIIEQNEIRKARKLSELMEKLDLGVCTITPVEDAQKNANKNVILSPLCALDEVSYAACNTLKSRQPNIKSEMTEHPKEKVEKDPAADSPDCSSSSNLNSPSVEDSTDGHVLVNEPSSATETNSEEIKSKGLPDEEICKLLEESDNETLLVTRI